MFCRLVLTGILAFLLTTVTLAQPKAPALPAINPGVAKLVRTIENLPGLGVAIGVSEEKGLILAGCEGGLRIFPREQGKEPLSDVTKAKSLTPHTGLHTSLAVSRSVAVSAYSDGKLLFWNLPAEKPTQTVSAATVVRGVAVSPDGKQVASVGDDKLVQLWDASNGKSIRKLTGPTDWLLAVSYSPGGKLIAAGGHDGRVWVRDANSGAKKFDQPVQAGPPPKDVPAPVHVVHSLAFSPDGKTLSVGASDGKIYQVTGDSGKAVRQLQGHTGVVSALLYHPSGNFLASASKDRSVRLWQATGAPQKTLEGHTAWAEGLAFIENGTILLSIGADRTVRVWDLGAVKPKEKKK